MKTRWLCQECGEVESDGGGSHCPRCGGELVGAAVEQLRPSDPLNMALGGYQFMFNELHETLAAYLTDHLKTAIALDFTGFIDVKVTSAGGKLIMRRNLRKPNAPAPQGRFWSLPVNPEVMGELFQRLAPAPPEEPTPTLTEVDASQVPLEDAKPAPYRPAVAVQRARAQCANVDEAIAALEWSMRHHGDDAQTLRDAATVAVTLLKKNRT